MTEISTEELARDLIAFRSYLGASRDSLMDEHDERRWDLLTEAAARLRALAEDAERYRHALEFYSNKRRYRGPNLYTKHEPGVSQYGHDDCPYVWDVTRDGGEIARQAIDKARHD